MRKSSLLLIILIPLVFFLVLSAANEIQDKTSGDFNNGTYNFTFYNSSGFIQLNSSRLNGTYTSQVFDIGSMTQWDNISFGDGISNEWFNSSWTNRKIIVIDNTFNTENLTDYQINITFPYDFEMQGNFSDLRFTDTDGTTELGFWVQNYTENISASVWINVPSISNTSLKMIYVYYGNPSAGSASNGSATFDFFEDFDNILDTTNKWSLTGGSYTLSNNRLNYTYDGSATDYLRSVSNFSRPFVWEVDFYPTMGYGLGWIGAYHGTLDFGTFRTGNYADEHTFQPYGGGGNSYLGHCDDGGCYHGQYVNPLPVGNGVYYQIKFNIRSLLAGPIGTFDSFAISIAGGGATKIDYGLNTTATGGDDPLHIGFAARTGTAGDNFEFDNMRVRKYTLIEPRTYIMELKFQVRTDEDNMGWGNFTGPDGSNNTFYDNPYNVLLNISDNPYFQYMVLFKTNNIAYTPNIYNVTIGYTILDLEYPSVTLDKPDNAFNTSSKNILFNFTATDDYPGNLNCSIYFNGILNATNSTVSNGSIVSFNISGISGGLKYWNVSCTDVSLKQNWSETRSFYIDTSPPIITNIVYFPNLSDDVDPYANITFNATIIDNWIGVSKVILQYNNNTGWTNITMSNTSATNYNVTLALISAETNYTFNIWANDTFGNSNHSVNQTFESAWDCTWQVTSDLGAIAGWDENKQIGNITLNNTGDVQYFDNNCSLSFKLTHNLDIGRIYFNDWGDNQWFNYYNTESISAKSNLTIPINSTFSGNVIKQESLIITTDEFRIRSNRRYRNTTGTIISNQNGPYLNQRITNSPTSIYLTPGNFTLQGYLQNVMGSSTINENNTAYNVSLYWTLPSGLTNLTGNLTLNFTNITDNSLHYNNLYVDFLELESMTSGIKQFYLKSYGYNLTGDLIADAGNQTILINQVNITFLCYNASDSIYVTDCGTLDGDYVEPTTASPTSTSGGGGGGGGGKTEYVKSSADFQLVRGEQNEVKIPFKNKDENISLKDLEFSVSGKIAKYTEVFPKTLFELKPGKEITLLLKITSPTYIEIGRQELAINIMGKKADKEYLETKEIVLEIHELSQQKSQELLEKSKQLIEQLNQANLSYFYLEDLLNESQQATSVFDYEKIRDNYQLIEEQATSALKSKEIIEELEGLIAIAEEKGIDTSNSLRLLKLAKLSLERKEFLQAYKRAKDAQVTYALEVKGEFGKISYYVKENKKEIALGALFLFLFSFGTYKVSKLQILKRKIKQLKQEEKIINELMRAIQIECFREKKISMDEYETAMSQYQKKLSEVIEELIELENKRAHELKFRSKETRMKVEREKIIELIKELQSDYLQKGKIETKSYELKLESYDKRLSEIDEKIAMLEAKKALKRGLGLFKKAKVPKEERL